MMEMTDKEQKELINTIEMLGKIFDNKSVNYVICAISIFLADMCKRVDINYQTTYLEKIFEMLKNSIDRATKVVDVIYKK